MVLVSLFRLTEVEKRLDVCNRLLRPCDPVTAELIPPSELEEHCRTHLVRPPCCLCPVETSGKGYTPSRISIVEVIGPNSTSVLNGEYVASCASNRCGYFGMS